MRNVNADGRTVWTFDIPDGNPSRAAGPRADAQPQGAQDTQARLLAENEALRLHVRRLLENNDHLQQSNDLLVLENANLLAQFANLQAQIRNLQRQLDSAERQAQGPSNARTGGASST